MTNVKVAVLDTGLDLYDNEVKNFYTLSEDLQLEDNKVYKWGMSDFNGHGTLVSKTIIDICKNVKIYPVKIFDNLGKTNSFNVILALQKILDSNIDIVNISASTFNYDHVEEFKKICDKLRDNKKIVICSKHNSIKSEDSIPTIFDSVIGVEGHNNIYENSEYIYRQNQKIQMYANSKDHFVKFKNNVTHFGKNSKACAVTTGIIANIVKNNPNISFQNLEEILINSSCNELLLNKNKKSQLLNLNFKNIDITDQRYLNIKNGILDIINTNFSGEKINLNVIKNYGLMNNITGIGKYNAYDFLININKYFNVEINYKDIYLYNLEDIDSLILTIYDYLNT